MEKRNFRSVHSQTRPVVPLLHALYHYYDDPVSLSRLIQEVTFLNEGGTLAVFLACHALKNNYQATIYSYNLQVFDPSWFKLKPKQMMEKLRLQYQYKRTPKLRVATRGYLEYLELGGRLVFCDLNTRLLQTYLRRSVPILTGLSATYLYRSPREYGVSMEYDDIRGESCGHFVVLCGYDAVTRKVRVADPLYPNPLLTTNYYDVDMDRLINAILLGILTYDANLLIIEPRPGKRKGNVNASSSKRSEKLAAQHP